MDSIRVRQVQGRDYRDPVHFLKRLRLLEPRLLAEVSDPDVRQLRTNRLREWRETRIGALFCHGMSERTGRKIFMSKGEFEDADFVAMWVQDDEEHFAPVQVKEVAPASRNPHASLPVVLESLAKYSGTDDLTVLIHFNRQEGFDPSAVSVPTSLRIAALWVLACIEPNQSEWGLWGNFLEAAEGNRFAYPA